MFAFHKNNAVTFSDQSSVDSFTTTPSPSNSMFDTGASQNSETSPHGDFAATHAKRHSVFTLRSRSNTGASITSNLAPPTSPSMAGTDVLSSRSLFRSKKGKRLSGTFSARALLHDAEESQAGTRRTSVLHKSTKHGEQSHSSAQHLKSRISSPFDFQHLTHTNRHHFASLQEASESELVNGFRAVRASQAPRRDLNGIKAEDIPSIPSPNCSREDVVEAPRRSTSAMELRPPPDFIDHVVDAQGLTEDSEDANRSSLRQSRSVESFSRPGINPHMHRHTQSATNPPPRVSSRHAAASSISTADLTITRSNRESGVWENLAPLSPVHTGGLLPSMAEEPDYMGHALTTPDDSAIHPMTPAFSPALEDVAEDAGEELGLFVSPRPAPLPPNKSPKSPQSPTYGSFSYKQRSPISRSHGRKDSLVLPKQLNIQNTARPMSQMSDTLVSPGLTRRHSIRKPIGNRRKSNTWRVSEESWEDDIDYIYDNALEAECELDWESPSSGGTAETQSYGRQDHGRLSAMTSSSSAVPSPTVDEEPPLSPGFCSSLLVPNMNSVPDLEPRSANSSSTMDTHVHTPSDYFTPHGFPPTAIAEGGRFSFAPSLLGPQDFKDQTHREELYDNLLADYEGLDKHFPLLEPARSIASSTRSSHVRTSKCSSYDSSLMSSGHGSGSWTAGIRRSDSSAGSLPELVHSSQNTRQDFSMVVDKLAEEVGSFTTQDKDDVEDDDVTPPGHTSQERTFFASDDEQEDSPKATLDAEMKDSLELARQGSNRSATRAKTNHKYASSDGVAKLRAPNTTAVRTRAGSVPQKSRGQYLSLFPAPPKRSPLSPLAPTAD